MRTIRHERWNRVIMCLVACLASCLLALADNTLKGRDGKAPLKVNYEFTGGDIRTQTANEGRYDAIVHPGEVITAFWEMTEGSGDGGGMRDWNHLSLKIATDREIVCDKKLDSESLPSLSGEYAVKEGDKEVAVTCYATTEWYSASGTSNSLLAYEIHYTVLPEGVTAAPDQQTALTDSSEEPTQDVNPAEETEKQKSKKKGSATVFYTLLGVAGGLLVDMIVLLSMKGTKKKKMVVASVCGSLMIACLLVAFLVFRPRSASKTEKAAEEPVATAEPTVEQGSVAEEPIVSQQEEEEEAQEIDDEFDGDLDNIDGIVDIDDDDFSYEAIYRGNWVSEGAYICKESELKPYSDYEIAELIERNMKRTNGTRMSIGNGRFSMSVDGKEMLACNYRVKDNGYLFLTSPDSDSAELWMYPGVEGVVYCGLKAVDDNGVRMSTLLKFKQVSR